MILRRLLSAVKKQDWFTVVIEILIVMIGIFLGLQVTEWNKARTDSQREVQVLQQITTDLLSDLGDYSSSLDATLNKIATATYIIEQTAKTSSSLLIDGVVYGAVTYQSYLDANNLLREKSFTQRVEALTNEYWSFSVLVSNAQPSTTAFDSIVSSGELSILTNKELVQSLQEYRYITSALQKAQDVTFRPARDNAINIGQQYGLSVFGGVEKAQLFELVSTNPQLLATIQTQLGWAKDHFVLLSATQSRAKVLLNKINQELGVSASDGPGL